MCTAFTAKGHSGYGEYGTDIVCAAISALTQACVMGITDVVKAPAHYITKDDVGLLEMKLLPQTTEEQIAKAQILICTLELALSSISKEYPGTIRIHHQRTEAETCSR